MLVYVRRYYGFQTSMEAIYTDPNNNVEELEYSLRLEDAAWFTLQEKWVVLKPKMKIKELIHLLHGDGTSPETCFEAKFRVGGQCVRPCVCVGGRVVEEKGRGGSRAMRHVWLAGE